MQSLPRIDVRYWLALSAASLFGTNAGDFVAGHLHAGHFAGLPWMLAAFLLILGFERLGRIPTPLWFWAAIVTMRTAATNVGDAFHNIRLGFAVSVPIMLVLLALCVAVYARLVPKRVAGSDTMPVNAAYWTAMMSAGVFGVVAGDLASRFLSDPGAAAAVFAIAVVTIALLRRRGLLLHAAGYWSVVALICTAGTAGGDTIAHSIGLVPSTFLTGAVFLTLAMVSSRSRGHTPRLSQP